MSSDKVVEVHINLNDSKKICKKLNLEHRLSDIREKCNMIDDSLLFATKEDVCIEREYEKDLRLSGVVYISKKKYYLYLTSLDWKILNNKRKIDYGRTTSFDGIKIANKRAFIINDCEITVMDAEGYKNKNDQLEFESKEDWMKKTNLFSADVNINSVGLGTSIERSNDRNFNDEIKSIYRYTEIGKVLLKLSKENLGPTDDFEKDVISAINSGNPREEFRKITEEYGQFISTEVILGGRVYFKDDRRSSENSADNSNAGPGNNSRDSESKSKFYNFEHMKLLGGKLPDVTIFDENVWAKSLGDYRNWDCIEFKNPVSIFQLLPNDLRKGVFKSIGKRILYTNTEDCVYFLSKPGMPRIYDLDNLPQNISKIIQNEDADCDFFASVVDTENSKDIFFNCQILHQSNGKTSIMIHCVQKKFRGRKYTLKIGLMVTGYDIDFDLILSDISVKLIKKDYDSQCQFYSIPLGRCKMKNGNPFFGIPILSDSDSKTLVIGHNFRSTQSNAEDKVDTFSYCLEKKCYVNLPKFTFCTFIIILNNPAHYASLPLKFKIFRNPFIDLEGSQSNSNYNPKYVSLYLSNNDNYKPIFLKQEIKRIKVKYVDCKCRRKCSICKDKTKKISKNENDKCISFDPNIRKNYN